MAAQNDIAYIKDQLQQGKITRDEANVMLVRVEGVRVIKGSCPADVRKALNAAVKAGQLGHLKKEGLKPECYFHPNSRHRATLIRHEAVELAAAALRAICI